MSPQESELEKEIDAGGKSPQESELEKEIDAGGIRQ